MGGRRKNSPGALGIFFRPQIARDLWMVVRVETRNSPNRTRTWIPCFRAALAWHGADVAKPRIRTTYDYAAPSRIVVGLCLEITTSTMVGRTGSAVAKLLPNLLGIWERIGRQSSSSSKPLARRRFLPRLREGCGFLCRPFCALLCCP